MLKSLMHSSVNWSSPCHPAMPSAHISQNGKVMRANKHFCVIAYDTPSASRRRKMVKALEEYGKRINYSVYECMLTPSQEKNLLGVIEKLVVKGKDQVAVYRLCLDCFSKISYIPERIAHTINIVTLAD